jgi:hypothetical protein
LWRGREVVVHRHTGTYTQTVWIWHNPTARNWAHKGERAKNYKNWEIREIKIIIIIIIIINKLSGF